MSMIERVVGERDIHKLDLHIHTYYSDGQASPSSIVKKAAVMGYSVIAITDHDGTGGVKEALAEGKEEGLVVIPGIELATELEAGIGLHILGYDMDTDDHGFRNIVSDLAKRRHSRNEKLIGVLRDMGYDIYLDELEKKQPGGFVGKPVIARALAEKGYVKDYREAFEDGYFLESFKAKTVKKEKLSAEQAIDVINRAGGFAVLAHPIQTRHIGKPGSEEFLFNMEKIITELKNKGLKGLECYHPDQNSEHTARFIKIAEKYDLLITRGSDFHGADYSYAEPTA